MPPAASSPVPIGAETTKAADGPAPAPDIGIDPGWDIHDGRQQPLSEVAPARRLSGSSGSFVRLIESDASDAIADHDNSDHEQSHNHDRHIVLHQPHP